MQQKGNATFFLGSGDRILHQSKAFENFLIRAYLASFEKPNLSWFSPATMGTAACYEGSSGFCELLGLGHSSHVAPNVPCCSSLLGARSRGRQADTPSRRSTVQLIAEVSQHYRRRVFPRHAEPWQAPRLCGADGKVKNNSAMPAHLGSATHPCPGVRAGLPAGRQCCRQKGTA